MFRYWTTKALQQEIGDKYLDVFEYIIPRVDGSDGAETFIGNKTKLAVLVESFQDHGYFKEKRNLIKCLTFVPPQELSNLTLLLDIPQTQNTIEQLSKTILSKTKNFQIFSEYFFLNDRFQDEKKEPLRPYFDNVPASETSPKKITKPHKTLKNFQYTCMNKTLDLLEPPMARALLQMPTGSGKTRTASEIIALHLNEAGDKPRQVVWLANTRELCEQAVQCMVEVWDHVGKKTCRFNRLWDGNIKRVPDWSTNECSFTVASLQTLWALLNAQPDHFRELFNQTTLVVVDEAHIAVAQTYSKLIKNLARTSHCKILGLTATPGRISDGETTALSDMFFDSIAFLDDPDPKRANPIGYLRSIGVLSEAFHKEIKYKTTQTIDIAENKSLKQGNDFSQTLLKKLGGDLDRTIGIVQNLQNLLDQGAKIIYFAPSVQNSFVTSAILSFLDYKSVHLSSTTSTRTRDTIISGYVSGKHQILCNYGVLATGFDAPKVDVVCIGRPTTSPVLYSQMIGRGLRGPIVGGTHKCDILEVQDNFINLETQDLLYNKFKDYWMN